jgi:hypothetical protein
MKSLSEDVGAGGTSVPGAGSQGAEQVGTRIAEWRGAGLAQVVMILFLVALNVSVFPYALFHCQ